MSYEEQCEYQPEECVVEECIHVVEECVVIQDIQTEGSSHDGTNDSVQTGIGMMELLTSLLLLLLFLFRFRIRSTRLDGISRVVVVSGAGSGIGRRTAHNLLAQGDIVVACDINERTLGELQKSCENPQNLLLEVFDISDATQEQAAAARIRERLHRKPVHCIVNCAGIIFGGPLVEMSDTQFAMVMDINVKGPFLMNKYFHPLLKSENSRVIMISSEIAKAGLCPGFSAPYAMSKIALEAYSTALRQELRVRAEGPIAVCVVNPGAMATPLLLKQFDSNNYFRQYGEKPNCLFKHALVKAGETAIRYMKRNANPPHITADVICRLVHSLVPCQRYVVGMSWEMYAASWTPQWLLDVVTYQTLTLRHAEKQPNPLDKT